MKKIGFAVAIAAAAGFSVDATVQDLPKQSFKVKEWLSVFSGDSS